MSELRRDPVSGDWIIVAPERAGRPKWFSVKKPKRQPSPKKTCPFEDLQKSGNWPPILSYPNEKNWEVILIPNKYPALSHLKSQSESIAPWPHFVKTGVGSHDLLLVREHDKGFADISLGRAVDAFLLLQKRYKMLALQKEMVYTSTFFNWGAGAGASIYHPHFQVLTLPIIPPDIASSLKGSMRYFRKYKRCVHCDMLKFDIKEKKRVIEKNSSAIAITPFVSREPFEVRIFPRRHLPYFEQTSLPALKSIIATLQSSLRRIKKYLNDPDFNFFIHTAPLKDHRYSYYHWHIEVLPKIGVGMPGGFELSTGVEINVVDPRLAAAVLKGKG